MKKTGNLQSLAREILIIASISAAIGLAWNHRLLHSVWTGQSISSGKESAPPVARQTTPLPLGLMQIKELFDRNEAVIVDARSLKDFTAGHIKGAIHLPLGEASARLDAFSRRTPKNAFLVIYCNGFDCHDSRNLGDILLKAGYNQVYVYEGGFPEWRDAGYPVSMGEK